MHGLGQKARVPGLGSQSLALSTQVAMLVQWAENLLISRAFVCRCPGRSALRGPVSGSRSRGVLLSQVASSGPLPGGTSDRRLHLRC